MSKDERKNAVVHMYPSDESLPERRTYVCFGVSRGGTSAVAGVMKRLGVYIGEDLPNNYEDPDFVGKPPPKMKETIAARNAAFPVWGWKFPSAANYLENLMGDLVNPHLIIVHRDLVATMKAHLRWHKRTQQFSVHEILLQQQRNWFLAERWQVPTALVSYEKAILTPKMFVNEMATFLGMPRPNKEAMAEMIAFLEPGSYK